MVVYTYDSWGKIISSTGTLTTTLGTDQPFRYRGYVCDTETQWYYLQSRYYDPTTCRFISADVLLSTGQGVLGHNSFAYCRNNSITRFDKDGKTDEDTEDVLNLIKSNVQKAKRLRFFLSLGVSLSISNPIANRFAISAKIADRYAYLYLNTKKGANMDYKNEDRWKESLPNLQFPGNDGEDRIYSLCGQDVSASDIGNINFGAVGAALGIPLAILLWQAGAAQLRDHNNYGFFRSEYASMHTEFYGDEEDDFRNIILGYNMYMEGYWG
ncbi:MAG: hypothetical protein J5854_07415 [Clostridia bacterium]|nr:hypothetical protein [Clostridia bacterium]